MPDQTLEHPLHGHRIMSRPITEELVVALSQAMWCMEPGHFQVMCERLRAGQPARDKTGLLEATRNAMRREDGVAIIEIIGPMFPTRTRYGEILGETPMDEVEREVEAATEDRSVGAILLLCDSPGGTVAGTASLARAVLTARQTKTVITWSPNVLASAAYWVASQGTRILVDRNAIVGSIGVRGPTIFDWTGMLEQMGLKAYPIGTSPFKLTGGFGPVSDAQVQDQQRIVEEIHENFTAAVRDGRRFSEEELTAVTDARVHVGPHALSMKLADRLASYDEAFEEARAAARGSTRGNLVATAAQQTTTNAGGRSADSPARAEGAVPQESPMDKNATAPAPSQGDAGQQQTGASVEPTTTQTQPTTTAPAADVKPVDRKAASMSELKAACPGASDSFLVEQSEKGATVSEAKDAHLAAQAAQITTLRAENAQLRQENQQLKSKAQPQAGVAPLPSVAGEQEPAATAVAPQNETPKAQAEREWKANHDGCQQAFVSEKSYVGYRVAELRGRIKSGR